MNFFFCLLIKMNAFAFNSKADFLLFLLLLLLLFFLFLFLFFFVLSSPQFSQTLPDKDDGWGRTLAPAEPGSFLGAERY